MIFMAEIFDGYMKQRLVNVALGRRKLKSLSSHGLPLESVTPQGNGKYTVQSQSNPSMKYEVDLISGFCECTVGENGDICKHQATCAELSMTTLPQVFTATPKNRHWLASVAVGTKNAPPEAFFKSLVEEDCALPSESQVSNCLWVALLFDLKILIYPEKYLVFL